MRRVAIATCVLWTAIVLDGCGGSARQIVHDARGGLFVLSGDGNDAHADAERQMSAHCGAGGHRVTFEGDVEVAEEETHERSVEDRTAQTRTVQSGDHTSWVEGQPAYAESGVTMSLDGDPQLYSPDRGARSQTMRRVSERHLEYECEEPSGSESGSGSGSGSESESESEGESESESESASASASASASPP